jgi:predicted nucleotidyltransferase
MTKDDIINNATNAVKIYEKGVLFAYLFGSTARAESSLSSDIDIAVYLSEGSTESYFETKLALYADLCRALKRNDVDLVILNTASNLILLEDIIRSGIVLFDRARDVREDFELGVLHRSIDFKTQRLSVMGV